MKHIFLILACILPYMSWADNVSELRAKEFAVQFLESSLGTRSSSLSLQMVYNGMDAASRGNGEAPPFYVFNNTQGKGFVIVSGEDLVTPILGYSSEHNFKSEQFPSNLKFWLANYATQIKSVRKSNVKANLEVVKAWQGISRSGVGSIVKNYETAEWGQGEPYNGDCYMIDGKHCITGCVATATAIVMRFNRWPDMGVGTLPSYSYKIRVNGGPVETHTVPERALGKSYDWDQLPLKGEAITTVEQKEQVARLMADCGVMVQAAYFLNSTGANSGDVAVGLSKYMKYDKSCKFAIRSSYPNEKWHRMLQNELSNSPIIYSGSGNMGGHAFVLYGYTDQRYYGTNWGWDGNCNGYFLLDALNPEVNYSFNEGQTAVLNLKKDVGGVSKDELRFTEGFKNDGIHHGLTVPDDTDFSQPFTVSVNAISNMGSDATLFSLRLSLTDKNGNEKEILDEWALNLSPGLFTKFDMQARITKLIVAGDRIRLFYQTDGSSEWKLVEGNTEKGIAWEIVVKEENENFAKHVNLTFDKQTKMLELTGLAGGVVVKLTNADGNDLTDKGQSDGMSRYTLDTKSLAAGTYTFTLTKSEFGETQTAQLKVVLGDNK